MYVQTHDMEDSFDAIGRQMNDIMDELTRRSYYRFSQSAAWEPAVNLYEDEEHLWLCVELAGMAQDEITVNVVDGKVCIQGERDVPRPPGEREPGAILHMEVNSGRFERTVELPDRADLEKVEARLDAGFLWIKIGKPSS